MYGTRVRASTVALPAAVILAASAVGAGCSASSGAPDTGSVSTVAASTTLAAASEPDCAASTLGRDLGALGYSACVGEWAAVMPTSYTDVCTDCESTWLARWDGSAWRLTAQCHAFTILTEDENGCSGVEGTFPDPTPTGRPPGSVPPADVACEIWGYNTLEENLAVTGCEPG